MFCVLSISSVFFRVIARFSHFVRVFPFCVFLPLGMENPDPKPEITRVDMPPIPLNAQPSVNIPPSTNRNLRNIQLADLDHMVDDIPDDIGKSLAFEFFSFYRVFVRFWQL